MRVRAFLERAELVSALMYEPGLERLGEAQVAALAVAERVGPTTSARSEMRRACATSA